MAIHSKHQYGELKMSKRLRTHGAFVIVICLSPQSISWANDVIQISHSDQKAIQQLFMPGVGKAAKLVNQNAQNSANLVSASEHMVDHGNQSAHGNQLIHNRIIASTLGALAVLSQSGTNTGNSLQAEHVEYSQQSLQSGNDSLPAQSVSNVLRVTHNSAPNQFRQGGTTIGNAIYASTAEKIQQTFKGDQAILNRIATLTPVAHGAIDQSALAIANLAQVEHASSIEQHTEGHQSLRNVSAAQSNTNAMQQSRSYGNVALMDGRKAQSGPTNVTISQSSSMSQYSSQNNYNITQAGNTAIIYQ